DELNIVFIVLNTFVAFTTSVFSAGYIGYELGTGRLTPTYLRFYHAMYQLLIFSMNLALLANNIGLMWVAIEIATLTTVILDELNIVFIVLNTFVAFTTSVFSAGYIGYELGTGRLTPTYLRFYHAMYQLLIFSMNLALLANNIGLMWVAIEIATLTTVVMV